MGKSHKKVKSDRINALRKQYDAFIEEDKKRKERNEYILGRLDKMRLCTTVMPLCNRINPMLDGRQATPYSLPGIMSENVSGTDNQPSRPNEELLAFNISRKHLNETLLLKEIRKKYILIPKLEQRNENNYPQATIPTQEDNIDWKSKYNILEKLKRDEKEESTDTYNHEFFVEPDTIVKENDEIRRQDQSLFFDSKNEIPEKDLSENKVEYKSEHNTTISSTNETYTIKPVDAGQENKNNIKNTNSEPVNTTENSIGYKMQNENNNVVPNMSINNNTESRNMEYESEIEKIDNTYIQNAPGENFHNNAEITNNGSNQYQGQDEPVTCEQYIPIVEENEKVSGEQIQYPHYENTKPLQVLNPKGFVKEINDEVAEDKETFGDYSTQIDNIQYNSINSQELETKDEIKIQDEISMNTEGQMTISMNTEGQMTDKENVEPTIQYDEPIVDEVTENPVDVAGIEEFDAEQREMFYSEQIDENCDVYNQGGVYNTEYTTQNENYVQDDQYPYYEGRQQEAYPVEINEHEETTQRYDQNYEQQYDRSYETQAQEDPQQTVQFDSEMYDQNQEGFDEHQQAYDENQQVYDENQAYNQYQYEQQTNETVQQVEQQLDYEQGYAEEKNRAVDQSSAIPTDQEQFDTYPVSETAQNHS